jgi:ATP-dependent Lon protease
MSSETTLPLLVARNAVLFPRVLLPLSVGRPSSVHAVEAALATEHKTLLVAVQTDASIEEPAFTDLFPFATRAVVKRVERAGDFLQVVLQGIDRTRLLDLAQTTPHMVARAQVLPDLTDNAAGTEAMHRAITELATKIAALLPPPAQALMLRVAADARDPTQQAYLLAGLVELETEKSLALLAANQRGDLLRLLHEYLSHELQVLELREQISSKAHSEMSQEQRKYLLRQQMQAIRKELGEAEGEDGATDELRERIEKAPLQGRVRTEVERELQRLAQIPASSPEHQLVRSWLELVAALPWESAPDAPIDLENARAVLDEDHSGLDEVKTRIIEYLAVMKLNPTARAPILCFVGPPGVGKTSLGKSIARATLRRFDRVSLGGVHDEAELRGHRRTYIGAMPGRVIQAIRRAGASNPLLMLDEIDKLGVGVHGDPAAALLEVLDPAQNNEFHDNYLDVPFDLSRVFFITTANTLDTVPRPLLDRMEVIRLSGYTDDEKVQIAKDHLLPRQLRETGLRAEQVQLSEQALRLLVRRYTREAGVRQLERSLGALCRKAAARIASGGAALVVGGEAELRELLGPERFFEEDVRARLAPGVAPGLAWTESGGTVLYVETVLLPQSSELVLTGQLGEVMRESARAALSWLRAHQGELGLDPEVVKQGVHVHVPAGATPKDGPSAGVAMATALASRFSGIPARGDVAMTGEITLSGLVLPVGGIREKLLAAHRGGIKTVVIPASNEHDLTEVPANARAGLEIKLARHVTDVLEIALPELTKRKQRIVAGGRAGSSGESRGGEAAAGAHG